MRCFWAEVRNIDDETQSGHVQVRIYNRQNNEQETPDKDLPWVPCMHPTTSAATAGVGVIPQLVVGSRVLVCYIGDDDHYPVILGSFARAKLPSKDGVRTEPDEESGGKINENDASPDLPYGTKNLIGQ